MTHRYDGDEAQEFIEMSSTARNNVFDLAATEGLTVPEAFGRYVEDLVSGELAESDDE